MRDHAVVWGTTPAACAIAITYYAINILINAHALLSVRDKYLPLQSTPRLHLLVTASSRRWDMEDDNCCTYCVYTHTVVLCFIPHGWKRWIKCDVQLTVKAWYLPRVCMSVRTKCPDHTLGLWTGWCSSLLSLSSYKTTINFTKNTC